MAPKWRKPKLTWKSIPHGDTQSTSLSLSLLWAHTHCHFKTRLLETWTAWCRGVAMCGVCMWGATFSSGCPDPDWRLLRQSRRFHFPWPESERQRAAWRQDPPSPLPSCPPCDVTGPLCVTSLGGGAVKDSKGHWFPYGQPVVGINKIKYIVRPSFKRCARYPLFYFSNADLRPLIWLLSYCFKNVCW